MLHALPGLLAVEVELQRKSASRMAGIASMYRAWMSEGRIAGVLYVCANARLADHVLAHAVQAGIPHGRGVWIELLDDVREQARGATRRPVQCLGAAGGARGLTSRSLDRVREFPCGGGQDAERMRDRRHTQPSPCA